MYAAGSEEEQRAGVRLHGGTIAQSFVFCKGGVAGASDSGVRPPTGTDGLVLACALHQRRVGLACAAIPPAPPSNVFRNRGTRCTPAGGTACPPAPAGDGVDVAFHLGASGSNEALLSSPGGESGSSVAGGRFLTTQRPRGTLVSGQWLGAAGPTDRRGGSEQTWGI